jgi:outer membrane protein assembly factor BamB
LRWGGRKLIQCGVFVARRRRRVVFVGSHDDYLYALDAKTGAERWRFKTGYRVYSSPAVTECGSSKPEIGLNLLRR